MSWESYLRLPWFDRWALHEELGAIIEETNEDGEAGAMRPKSWRK